MLEYKLIDADSYISIGDNYYNSGDYNNALECYNRAFISYLEVYGNNHPESVKISEKVNEITEKMCSDN